MYPRDIRNQTGSFAEAFAKHEENFKHELEKVKTWRTALTAAGKLSGWDSQVTRPESRLIDEIVDDILKKLNRGTSNAYLKGLVGIHRRMEQVMSLIQVGFPDVRRLGIWGMGGTGKTTLAEAIFHHISNGFQSCYFLANVRESEEHGRLFQLRQEFLSTIMEDENLNISTPTIGAGFLKDRLSRKMVLIVCDDVSNSSQLEFLFKGINQLCPGSRVIVTTRNKQVLIQNDIDLIYEMEKLDEDESLQLFCQRAFKSNYPTGYRFLPSLYKATSLTTLILSDCSILFSFPEVSSNLRELHLEGTTIEQVPSSMESLSQLVLLSMEDCVRLNNFPTAICSLRSLEVFSLNGSPNITTFPEISGNITELNLGGTAIEEVPSSIECFSNLRVFNLGCCRRLKSVSTSIHKLKSLKVFYLEECSKLEIFPEILDTMERLRYLELSGTALKELSSSMENLIGLVELRLNNCENLVYLPDNFYKLKSLKFLYLYGCSNLVTWPDNLFSAIGGVSLTEMRRDLHGLSSLEELDLTGSNLENLPTSIKQLPRLKQLILRKCKRLKSLPELPPSLKHLDAHDCTSLEEVSSIKKPFEQAVLCKDRPYGHLEWIFSNCFQLDQKAVRNTRTPKLQMLFGHMEFPKINKVITCVPGSEIPEWFDFKSSGSSINIQLPSKWYYNSSKNFPTFVVSTVVSFQDYSGDREILIRCKCRLKSRNGDCHDLSCSFLTWTKRIPGSELTGSNHLFLLYKTCFCDEDDEIRWFVETQASNKHMYNEAWFKFHPLVFNGDWSQNICCEVKHCGVHISFAEEEAEVQPSKRFKYQN
ncbi:hypothetical protein GOBAR_AA36989 [Gossypium barbadense]|uniref:ADP-ribosyl cyclase/cyclic ADP-ribose hydrolase n=1 Tax=Gossypium barbadense TaxID=3634 RepID=A0A2P5VXZ9_GOSBA|nr:hypothetical protein GOBAR_AA36989 [Gossypium barbadense]